MIFVDFCQSFGSFFVSDALFDLFAHFSKALLVFFFDCLSFSNEGQKFLHLLLLSCLPCLLPLSVCATCRRCLIFACCCCVGVRTASDTCRCFTLFHKCASSFRRCMPMICCCCLLMFPFTSVSFAVIFSSLFCSASAGAFLSMTPFSSSW